MRSHTHVKSPLLFWYRVQLHSHVLTSVSWSVLFQRGFRCETRALSVVEMLYRASPSHCEMPLSTASTSSTKFSYSCKHMIEARGGRGCQSVMASELFHIYSKHKIRVVKKDRAFSRKMHGKELNPKDMCRYRNIKPKWNRKKLHKSPKILYQQINWNILLNDKNSTSLEGHSCKSWHFTSDLSVELSSEAKLDV